jgi:uncharacterized hydrophobic protein (TIGR00271 family)
MSTIDDYTNLRTNISNSSKFDSAYIIMNFLATSVATYGLFANSPAVVIGAMIIAMLLGPITGVSLGLVDGNRHLLTQATLSLLGGMFIVLASSYVYGLIFRGLPITNEIMARTAPNLLDLLIALAGGAAGAYATVSPTLRVAFVGVAIATVIPPENG